MSDSSIHTQVIFIGIAGPSGSGKSTYARHLGDRLQSPLYPIQLDHFFIDAKMINHPILGKIKTYEEPECLSSKDFLILLQQIKQNPETITRYHREDILIDSNKPLFIIIEGFLLFALSDEITNLIDIRIFLDSTLNECRMGRYRRKTKIKDDVLNEDIEVSNEFQQWFDHLVWNEYLKRRDLQVEKSEKIFHSIEYQQKQYLQLDNYIDQRLKDIIESKKSKL
jgi:uridine kinase